MVGSPQLPIHRAVFQSMTQAIAHATMIFGALVCGGLGEEAAADLLRGRHFLVAGDEGAAYGFVLVGRLPGQPSRTADAGDRRLSWTCPLPSGVEAAVPGDGVPSSSVARWAARPGQ
jgi:hypothetical protein